MQAETVVAKTPKGEQAIAQRSPDLDRHLRYVLILVDGSSSVAELRAKGSGLAGFDESLERLAEQGFIAPHLPTEATGRGPNADFAEVKEQLIRVARELLGVNADKVVNKVQAAPESRDGILDATASCKKMIKLIIDEDKAEQLMLRCSEILKDL